MRSSSSSFEPAERLDEAFVVEIHAPDDVDLRLLPVATLEPALRAARDVGEAGVVVEERVEDQRGGARGHRGRGGGGAGVCALMSPSLGSGLGPSDRRSREGQRPTL